MWKSAAAGMWSSMLIGTAVASPVPRDAYRAGCAAVPVRTERGEVPLDAFGGSRRGRLAGLALSWVAAVHRGLPMQEVPAVTTASDGRYLVFLGRMSAEKRPDLAIAVAKRAGLPLI